MEISITREPDDRTVPARASIGGDPEVGYYLVFRGEPQAVITAIETILERAKRDLPARRYADRRGRPQG